MRIIKKSRKHSAYYGAVGQWQGYFTYGLAETAPMMLLDIILMNTVFHHAMKEVIDRERRRRALRKLRIEV